MRRVLTILLIIGGIIGGAYVISGKATESILQNALVTIKDLSFAVGATVLDVVQGIQPLILTIEVTNTQNIGTTINSFIGTAYMLGQPVAQVADTFNIKIGPGETVIIDIPIILNSQQVLAVAGDAVKNKTLPDINVKGEIVANSFIFPVDEVFSFS